MSKLNSFLNKLTNGISNGSQHLGGGFVILALSFTSAAAHAASSITVTGTPGQSQLDQKLMVRIEPMKVDNQGNVLPGNLTSDKFPQYAVGQKVPLTPGKYYVSYSHNYNVVDLAADEDKVIALQYIAVKPIDGSYKFKVFTDLTAPEEQDKELLFVWLVPNILEFTYADSKKFDISMPDMCRKAKKLLPLGKQHCTAILGNNYKATAPFFQFNSDASVTMYGETYTGTKTGNSVSISQNGELWQPGGRIATGDGADGDAIAVMPGIYGIEYTNLEGVTSEQYHVLSQPSIPTDDQTGEEVPQSIRTAPSAITVVGTPGPTQANLKLGAKIQRLKVDTHGHLAKGDLDYTMFMEMPLGLRYVTAPGKYYIGYSHNFIIVDLAPGEDKVIDLKPLTIPKTDGQSKFKVYTDLTVPEEQDKEMLFYWVTPNVLTFNISVDAGGGHKYKWQESISQSDLCRKASTLLATGKKFCAALLGDNYQAMAPFYKFAADATGNQYGPNWKLSGLEKRVYAQSSDSWLKIDRVLVADGVDGDTIAVTPGTYIIEITDGQGHVTTQTHIEAK